MSRVAGEPRKRRKWRAARAAAVLLLVGVVISVVLLMRSCPRQGWQGSVVEGSAIVDLLSMWPGDAGKTDGGKFRGAIVAPGRVLTVHHGVVGAHETAMRINGGYRKITGVVYADAARDVALLSFDARPDDPKPMLLAADDAEAPKELVQTSFSQTASRRLRVEHVDQIRGMGRVLVMDRKGEHGMSGSPLVSDDGVVWGVHCASFGDRGLAAAVSRADLAASMSDGLREANGREERADAAADESEACLERNDIAGALEHARRAVEISGGGVVATMALVRAHLDAGAPEEAAVLVRGLIEEAGESLWLSEWAADRLYSCGLWDEALPIARRAAELSGGHVDDQVMVAMCLERQGRYPELIEVLTAAEERKESGAATGLLAEAYQETDAFDECIALGADGSEIDGFAALYIGNAYTGLGRFEEAAPWLRRASEMRPDDVRTWDSIAYALGKTGSPEAEEAARRALEMKPDSAGQMYRLGWVQLTLGRYGDAKATLTGAAAAYGGESPPLWVKASLGNACFWLGEYEEARGWYVKSGGACAIPYVVAVWVERAERVREGWGARR